MLMIQCYLLKLEKQTGNVQTVLHTPISRQNNTIPSRCLYIQNSKIKTEGLLICYVVVASVGVHGRKAMQKLKKEQDLLKIRQAYKYLFTNRKFYSFNGNVVVMISQYT